LFAVEQERSFCYFSEVAGRLRVKRFGWRRLSARVVSPLLIATLSPLFVGCGSAAGAPAAGSSSLPSAACDGQAKPGDSVVTIDSGGMQRTVLLHLPSGYDDRHQTPLVLNLHGSESTAAAQESFTGMDATADSDGFIVAYPQAAIAAGTGFDWNVPGQPLLGGSSAPSNAPGDVVFLQQSIDALEAGLCVDATRIYVTGFSGGARMASQVGCDLSTVVAAIAPVSGLRFPAPCPATRPLPVIAFHGTVDPVDPYNGNGQAYWTYSVPSAAQRWAAFDGCTSAPVVAQPQPSIRLSSYAGCKAGAAVSLYTIDGEGHEWPGGPHLGRAYTAILGAQSDAISANNTMWQFFSSHPLA
jgi:polyhydroxybutyrate depolymerase